MLRSASELHKNSNFNFKRFKQIPMRSKILLFTLSVAVFSSCSTAYKTGQTPDDVYYSPVKPVAEKKYTEKEEDRRPVNNDYEITMAVRDHRWRNFRDDYQYDNSPYNYCYCNCNNTGYYYNPYYYPWAIYTSTPAYAVKVNTTPRMVNLNAYNGYNTRVANGKTNGTSTYSGSASQYNNSNRSGSRLRDLLRQPVETTPSSSSSSNNTRSYTPSSSGSSSSGSSSSGSSSGSVSRPGRGG
jgi:hypothetical protein